MGISYIESPFLKVKHIETLQLPVTEESAVTEEFKRTLCCYCRKNFLSINRRIRHENYYCFSNPNNSAPRQYEPHICKTCGKVYSQQRSLNYHVKHDCNRKHKCAKCHRIFSETSGLRRHLRKNSCLTFSNNQ